MSDSVDQELLLRKLKRERAAREAAEKLIEEKSRELYDAKIAAEDAERAKSEFLATMGHELRTPLNAIIGFSEFILQEKHGPIGSDSYREFLGDIHESGGKLLSVINNILDVSRLQASSAQSTSISALSDLLEEAIGPISSEAKSRKIRIITVRPVPLIGIRGDDEALGRVFRSLIDNAVKFSDDKSTVKIEAARKHDGKLVVDVSDSGIGIAAEDQARIFKPFVQIDGGLDRRREGTGLGLTIAHSIVKLHGGSITVRSEPGIGSVFSITFGATRTVDLAGDTGLQPASTA